MKTKKVTNLVETIKVPIQAVVRLHVKERLDLMRLLPRDGGTASFKIMSELKSALSFSEDEYKKFQIIEDNGQISWVMSEEKEIYLGEQARQIVIVLLSNVPDEAKISFSLFEKFIK
jgi:hypothetical protein